MKSIPQRINQLLWSNQEDYFNKVGYAAPFISFKALQWTRLITFFIVLIVWALNLYINVKKVIIYINFWALSANLLSIGYLFASSGRQVIERKLRERGEPVAEKDRSSLWKLALLFYTIAWPFTLASTISFFVWFSQDQICQTYVEFGIGEWRSLVLYVSVIISPIVLLLDFALNRLVVSMKHLLLNVFLMGLYLLISFIGAFAQGRPVYGNNLGFQNHNGYNWPLFIDPPT